MLFAESLTRSYGAHDVLREVTFAVNAGERVGLVGANGSGKTTLLRLLAGLDEPDKGECGHKGGTLGYLPQDSSIESSRTLVDEMWTAFPEAKAVDLRLHEIASQLESGGSDIDALVEEQGELFHEFDRLDGYRIEKRIGRVLAGLGFTTDDWTKRCGDFSGGWRMRIALAKVMVHRPEHLLLDEPTNHLDTAARDWLAEDLSEYRGTVLIVTHDAEFLDKVANRILELRDCEIRTYAGNYSEYQRIKAERLTALDQAAARQERELAKQQRFIDRFRAKNSKATLVKSREKAVAKIERVERDKPEQDLHFQIEAQGRTENDVLYMEHIGHAYGDNVVLIDVNLHIQRGQKVVLIGPNGSGKSTLLRIAAEQIAPSEGYMRWADKARRGYYDQHQDEALDPAKTVLEEVESIAPSEREERLRAVLGQFLFTGDDVHKPVRMLSGGERSRVALAKLVIQPTNVLILDEPTNHLDRSTRRRLLDVLESYDGTVLCAAHDPGLLDRVATRVYEVVDGACTELIERRREPRRKKSLGRQTRATRVTG